MSHQGGCTCAFISNVTFGPINSLLYSKPAHLRKVNYNILAEMLVENSTSFFFIDSSWEHDLYNTMVIGHDQS